MGFDTPGVSWQALRISVLSLAASAGLAGGPVAAATDPALPPIAAGTFPAYAAVADYTYQLGNTNQTADILGAGSLTLGYDPGASSYTVTRSGLATTFGPAQLQSTDGGYDYYASAPFYQVGTGSIYSTLTLLRNIDGNPAIDLHYLSYGLTSTQRHIGAGTDETTTMGFVIGEMTPAIALPHSGAAYYTGIIDGYAGLTRLTGSTGDVLLNFYSGEVATGLNLRTASASLGRVDGRGSILSGTTQFAGDLFGSGNTYLGRFDGGAFGPAAQEVGYGFALTSPGNTPISGVLVATQASLPPTGPSGGGAPAASSGANASLVAPIASDSFATFASDLKQNHGVIFGMYSGVTASVAEQLDYGALTINYDATSDSYVVSDGAHSQNFTPAALQPSNHITADYRISGTSGGKLSVLLAGAANSYFQLSYLSYGLWSDDVAQIAQNNYRSFTFGIETPATNLPHSGAALFNGIVDGYWASSGPTYRLLGESSGSILANFYTGEVRTTMTLAGTDPTNGAIATLGQIDGYGQIAGATSHYAGTMANSDSSYTGTFQGAFYGPSAQEAGLSFVLRGPSIRTSVTGVLVAGRVPLH